MSSSSRSGPGSISHSSTATTSALSSPSRKARLANAPSRTPLQRGNSNKVELVATRASRPHARPPDCGRDARNPDLLMGRRGGRRAAADRRFHGGDTILDRLLDLLERPHLDLAHALARYAEFDGEVLQCHWLVGKPPRL